MLWHLAGVRGIWIFVTGGVARSSLATGYRLGCLRHQAQSVAILRRKGTRGDLSKGRGRAPYELTSVTIPDGIPACSRWSSVATPPDVGIAIAIHPREVTARAMSWRGFSPNNARRDPPRISGGIRPTLRGRIDGGDVPPDKQCKPGPRLWPTRSP